MYKEIVVSFTPRSKLRITWYRISLISLLAIALNLVLSFSVLSQSDSLYRLWNQANLGTQNRDSIVHQTEIYSSSCVTNLQQQKFTAALANCKQVVESNPKNLEAHLNLGLAYYHLHDYPRAIAQNRQVIEQNSRDYRAFYNWGLINSAKGEYQQAIERYQVALDLVANNSQTEQALILNDIGAAWIMLKNYDAAIASLDRVVELDPNSLAGYFNRGCANHRQGNYQRGIADFTQVIALDANYTEAYISRAILEHLTRQEKAAYSDLDVALGHYQTAGNLAAREKIMNLKNSMVASKVQQTA